MQRILFGRLDQVRTPTVARKGSRPRWYVGTKHRRTTTGFVEELRAGRIEIVAAVVGFDQRDVVLADGARIQPDAVIAATPATAVASTSWSATWVSSIPTAFRW